MHHCFLVLRTGNKNCGISYRSDPSASLSTIFVSIRVAQVMPMSTLWDISASTESCRRSCLRSVALVVPRSPPATTPLVCLVSCLPLAVSSLAPHNDCITERHAVLQVHSVRLSTCSLWAVRAVSLITPIITSTPGSAMSSCRHPMTRGTFTYSVTRFVLKESVSESSSNFIYY